jgi:hypothetical protein
MKKQHKTNATQKPPLPSDDHATIEDWIRRVMPDLHPIVKRLDELIREKIPGLQYAIKWGKENGPAERRAIVESRINKL